MAKSQSLDLIGKTVVESRDAVRKLAGLPDSIRQLQDDQTVMIRLLQTRDAEIALMRSRELPFTDRTWRGQPEGPDAKDALGSRGG